jgi:hypothetical protein
MVDTGVSLSSPGAFFAAGRKRGAPKSICLHRRWWTKKDLALQDPQEKMRKWPANPTSTLSTRAHTRHMEPSRPARIVLILIGALMLTGWALIIWVATIVTQTMLSTLQYIVDLAQMS